MLVPFVVEVTLKQAWPVALVVPGVSPMLQATAVMEGEPGPLVCATLTILPDMVLLFSSLIVAVRVLVVVPSASTLIGEAVKVEVVGLTVFGVKVTLVVWVITTSGFEVVSVAVKTFVPAVVEETVKQTSPEELLTPAEPPEAHVTGVMVGEPGPLVVAAVTVLPVIRLLDGSLRVAVRVLVARPLAITLAGKAVKVELSALTGVW